MTPAARASGLGVFSSLTFAYFAAIGLFNPYAPLWFQSLGFSTVLIGGISSLQSWTRIVAPYGWSWLGDHGGQRAELIRRRRGLERKRIDLLLLACARLGTNPRLVIVEDGPELGALESLANGLYPQAKFVGAKHGAELEPYFLEADLFVLPGTGGLAVQEAMSYGLPVIVAQGDGTQDDLVRQENGWQVPPGDFDALLGAIYEALSDPARLRRMGAESYRIVKEEINIERMVDTFVAALNSVTPALLSEHQGE